MRFARLLLFLTLLPVASATSTELHVPSQYSTIQAALDAAVSGDEVVLASGVYTESIVVPPVDLTLRSASGIPDDVVLDGGSLTGDLGDPSFVEFIGDGAMVRTLHAVTIRNAPLALRTSGGGVVRLEACRFLDNGPVSCVIADAERTVVESCEFIGNSGYLWGGAIRALRSLDVDDCTFVENVALPYQGLILTQGGAIKTIGVKGVTLFLNVTGSRFERNHCTDYGGAIDLSGGSKTESVIRENVFVENVADVCAGAIYNFGPALSIVIDRNVFIRNESPLGATIGFHLFDGGVITGNTIVGSKGGEALRLEEADDVEIRRNIIAFNEGQALAQVSASSIRDCNDYFSNGPQPREAPDFGLDPLFCDADADDYRLDAESPCLPANNECGVLVGALESGCVAVPTERTSWGGVKGVFLLE